MTWQEAKNKTDNKTWAFLELRPTGKVLTKEQYEYILYYGQNNAISVDDRYIKSFEEECGKYLHLGSWFGGASFYFYFSENPERNELVYDKDGCFVGYKNYFDEFSFGKFGKINFE